MSERVRGELTLTQSDLLRAAAEGVVASADVDALLAWASASADRAAPAAPATSRPGG